MKKIALISAGALLTPLFAFAQQSNQPTLGPFVRLVQEFGGIISLLIPILLAATVAAMFFGLFNFIFGGAKDAAKGKNIMLWGVGVLFVMVSLWGIIAFTGSILGITPNGGAPLKAPTISQ